MKRKGQITTVIPDVIAILVFLVLTLLFIIAIRIDLGVWVHGNDVASPEGKQKTFTVLGNYTLDIVENDYLLALARTPVPLRDRTVMFSELLTEIYEKSAAGEITLTTNNEDERITSLWRTVATTLDTTIGPDCYWLTITFPNGRMIYGYSYEPDATSTITGPISDEMGYLDQVSTISIPAKDAKLINISIGFKDWFKMTEAGFDIVSECKRVKPEAIVAASSYGEYFWALRGKDIYEEKEQGVTS